MFIIHNFYIVYVYKLHKSITLYACVCSIYSWIHVHNVL